MERGRADHWGRAENGDVIVVGCEVAAGHIIEGLWPAIGLCPTAGDIDAVGDPARSIVVRTSADGGAPLVEVDGAISGGGWDRVESELTVFAAERLTNLVAVHAAVIVHDGRAIVAPGPSHAGKSRLSLAAHALGMGVLSDEFALVDCDTGFVTGWPRQLRVRRGDGSVDRLDIVSPSPPIPVGLIALVDYDPSTVHESFEDLSEADAVMGVVENTASARSSPDRALDAALALARSCRAVGGSRADARHALHQLVALVDEPGLR